MTQEALKLALDALENHTAIKHPQQIHYRDKAITALREALTEQPAQQEPVAWIDEFGNVFPLGAQRGPKHLNEPMKPLYTTPPQRKPLTDEEIEREWQFLHDEEGNPPDHHDFARAIEAAHGIKE